MRFGHFFGIFSGSPAAGAEISIFCGFRRPGHVKYSVLGLPGLDKTSLLKPIKHCKLQCFVASEATKHCKLQCFVASKRDFACFGGSRGPPGGPWPSRGAPGRLWGPFWALFWGFLRLSWRLLGRSWRLLGRSREAQEAPEGSKLVVGGTKRHPRVSGLSSGVLGCRAGGVWL